ncbi:hypothetical protein A3C87_02575, partial [Candidatus Kaiserbacteria bacterium RIFCSPHIGHO2_02_FULL_49_34]
PTAAERNIDLRTDESNELSADLYWNIAIPASGVKGACVGSNTIAIVAQAGGGSGLPAIAPAVVLHYKPDALIAGTLTNWNDESVNAAHVQPVAGFTAPTVVANVLNGLPVVRLSSSMMSNNNDNGPLLAFKQVFVVAKYSKGSNFTDYDGLFTGNSSSLHDTVFIGASGGTTYYRDSTTDLWTAPRYTDGVLQDLAPMNRFGISSVSISGGWTGFHPRFGMDRTTVRHWGGDIAELIAYDAVLTDTERQKIEGYLAHKYGLQSTLPAGHPYKTVAP